MSDQFPADSAIAIRQNRKAAGSNTKPLVVVVGADGFVGGGLAKALQAETSSQIKTVVYGPASDSDVHISRAEDLIRRADIVLNCGGFRVRPGCDYRDYQRSHQGST